MRASAERELAHVARGTSMLWHGEKMEQRPLVDAQLDLAGRCFADELPKLLDGRLYDLQLLDVADNSLGDAGVSALVAALCQPGCGAQLRFLGLAKNAIGDDGGCAIAGWLQLGGGALQHLELRDNGLADRAAAALAAVLRGPSALEHLSLFHNSVGRRGAAALADALRANRTLGTLDLRLNLIDERELQTLLQGGSSGGGSRSASEPPSPVAPPVASPVACLLYTSPSPRDS